MLITRWLSTEKGLKIWTNYIYRGFLFQKEKKKEKIIWQWKVKFPSWIFIRPVSLISMESPPI